MNGSGSFRYPRSRSWSASWWASWTSGGTSSFVSACTYSDSEVSATWLRVPTSRLAGSPSAFCREVWSFTFPALEDSLRRLSALVTYLRTWVASWVATQPRATKKIKPNATTRSSTEPSMVSQAGSALSRRFLGRRAGDLLGPPEGLARRDFGADLWDLRSMGAP